MLPILYVVIAGIVAVFAVMIVLLFGIEVVVPYYDSMGSTAGAELGVTANQAIGMDVVFAFGAMMLVAVPLGIALWLFTGNDRDGYGRGQSQYREQRQERPPRRRE